MISTLSSRKAKVVGTDVAMSREVTPLAVLPVKLGWGPNATTHTVPDAPAFKTPAWTAAAPQSDELAYGPEPYTLPLAFPTKLVTVKYPPSLCVENQIPFQDEALVMVTCELKNKQKLQRAVLHACA